MKEVVGINTGVMKSLEKNLKYQKAQRKVEKLKRFYSHLAVFITINTVITIVKVMYGVKAGQTISEAIFSFSTLLTWMAWGIALALHAFSVFILPKLVGDDWEERMIQKHMKEELNKD